MAMLPIAGCMYPLYEHNIINILTCEKKQILNDRTYFKTDTKFSLL